MVGIITRISVFLLYVLALYLFMIGSTILTIVYVYKYTSSIFLTVVACYITLLGVGKIIYDVLHFNNKTKIRYMDRFEYILLHTSFYMEVISFVILFTMDNMIYAILIKLGLVCIEVLLLYICKNVYNLRKILEEEDNKIIKGVD